MYIVHDSPSILKTLEKKKKMYCFYRFIYCIILYTYYLFIHRFLPAYIYDLQKKKKKTAIEKRFTTYTSCFITIYLHFHIPNHFYGILFNHRRPRLCLFVYVTHVYSI